MASRRRQNGGWTPFDAADFALDCLSVIALRTMRIAAGGPAASREIERMFTEKAEAATGAQLAAAAAFPVGGAALAAERAAAIYRRTLRANKRRLTAG